MEPSPLEITSQILLASKRVSYQQIQDHWFLIIKFTHSALIAYVRRQKRRDLTNNLNELLSGLS